MKNQTQVLENSFKRQKISGKLINIYIF